LARVVDAEAFAFLDENSKVTLARGLLGVCVLECWERETGEHKGTFKIILCEVVCTLTKELNR
jgi:hypothetical protein